MTSFKFTDGIKGYADKIPSSLEEEFQSVDYDEGEEYIIVGSGGAYSVYSDDVLEDIMRELFNINEEVAVIQFDKHSSMLIDRVESGDGTIYIGAVNELIDELA